MESVTSAKLGEPVDACILAMIVALLNVDGEKHLRYRRQAALRNHHASRLNVK
jgi:hypothetical protein